MKFFHLSDLHIGKQLHHYNMSAEQTDILQQILLLARQEMPDAVLIAGDIYDTPVPSAESVAIFDRFLTELSAITPEITILVIAGNHDSARRLSFANNILEKHGVYIEGLPPMQPEEHVKCVTLSDEEGEVDFYLLPFTKPSYVRKVFDEEITGYDMAVRKLLERETIDTSKRNVIVSHQFYTASGMAPEMSDSEVHMAGGIENVDVSVLEPFDYAALGHIHRPQRMGKEIYRYCGTPLSYSVSEALDEKSVTVVELGAKGGEPVIRKLPLEPLRQVRKLTGTLEKILTDTPEEWNHDFVSITLTDDIEAYRPKEQLEERFDHILEIRVDNARTRKMLAFSGEKVELQSPYDAFQSFFYEMNGREMTAEESSLIQTVINMQKEMEDV